jgi:hypothetical protein
MEGSAAVNYGWRKSSYSNGGGSTCVEAGHVRGAILIRDTTDNGMGLTLRVTPAAWTHFTTHIRLHQELSH